jgi:chromosome partitioning protein
VHAFDPLFPVIGLPKAILHRERPTLAASYDHVVTDGPPCIQSVRAALSASREVE